MEVTSLPIMTKWQFYAMFAVQFALGVLFGYAMFYLSDRDPKLGWKPSRFMQWVRDKLFVILIVLAGIASFQLLPDIFKAFTSDAVDVIGETIANTATNAMDGKIDASELPHISVYDEGRVVWGEPDEAQNEALVLMSGFWLFIGWFIYVGGFKASPVGFFKKLIKVIAYSCLSCILLFTPMDLHYFTFDEIAPSAALLVIGVVGVLVTYSGNKLPPPLPAPENGSERFDPDDKEFDA